MMLTQDKLLSINSKISDLQKISRGLESSISDFVKENIDIDLNLKYEELDKEYSELLINYSALKEESLKKDSEIRDLKNLIMDISRESKEKIYHAEKNIFMDKIEFSSNSFEAKFQNLKNKLLNKIKKMELSIVEDSEDKYSDIFYKIQNLKAEIEEYNLMILKKEQEFKEGLTKEVEELYDNIQREENTKENLEKRVKESRTELIFGLNWLNKIGIILVIFGVVSAFRYSYSTWFNDYAKGIVFFLSGIVFLSGGEYFDIKKKIVFSRGLTGGGIGILYASTFFSYFLLKIMSFPLAIALSVLITATSIYLTTRYSSKTIGVISLIGGYLPVISYIYYFNNPTSFIYLSFYVALLNILLLGISVKNNWKILNTISYILHIPFMGYLYYEMNDSLYTLFYVNLIFVLYLGVILIYPLKYKKHLNKNDTQLLILNTFVSFILSYFILKALSYAEILGIIPIVYGLVYFVITKYINDKFPEYKKESLIGFALVLSFSILIIPIQFGLKWLTLGWLIQGGSLVYVGLVKKEKDIFKGGSLIFFLGQVYYFLYDFHKNLDFQWFSFIIATLVICLSVIYYYVVKSKYKFYKVWEFMFLNTYKNIIMIVLGFYLVYITEFIRVNTSFKHYDRNISDLMLILLIYIYAYVLKERKELQSSFTKIYSNVLILLGVGGTFVLNTKSFPLVEGLNIKIPYLIVLFLYNVVCILLAKRYVRKISYKHFGSIEFYPIIVNVIVLSYAVSYLTVQLNMVITNFYFNLVIVIIAVINLLIGFKYRYRYLRYTALAMILFVMTKTFFLDIQYISHGIKIIAFFVYGGILIAISYLYQHLSERFQVKFEGEN